MDERVRRFNDMILLKKTPIEEENIRLKNENLELKKTNSQMLTQRSGVAQCWHDGVGLPPNSLGNIGDYYLQLPESDIFKKLANEHWERIGNIKGEKGFDGIDGENGENGINGINGKDGKQGVPGEKGANGLDGTFWYDGVGTPAEEVGNSLDKYLDLESGDIYTKDKVWLRVGNIRGPRGIEGPQGEIGTTPSIEHLENTISQTVSDFSVFSKQVELAEDARNSNEIAREEYINSLKTELTVTEEDISEILNGILR